MDLPHRDLAYLTEGTDEFDAYLREMRWAQTYALFNREEMMDRVVRQFGEWVGGEVERLEEINCHRTASYVVVGKGHPASLSSAPHGAGRAYSRTRARKTFTAEDLRAAMTGIEYRDTDAFIDEIPAAYKDIDQVMADAADLVEVRHVLRQLVNVKGD
ncbi:conserved hypothetical protein [metagenome]|uniref:3'-phosphate/5'-hydroxy nucleic acid ligase n=1 Tax=metagenome TaxID=256318 RepID=A0A2P2CDP0_9ZZZZ